MDLNFLRHHQSSQIDAVEKKVDVSSYDKVISWIFQALVFLTPIFFLTITSEALEFNKQNLIFFAVLITLGIWIIKILVSRSVSWVKTSLDYLVVSYLVVYLISSLTSIDKVSSFLGATGRFTGSFVSIFSLVIFYFLLVNHVRNSQSLQKITKWLTFGSFVVIGYGLLQIFGLTILPFINDRSFNTVGSMVSLAIFCSIFVVFYQWQLSSELFGKIYKIALGVFVVLGLVLMFLINAFAAWIILALGMVAFLALSMVLNRQSDPNSFWKPFLVLAISILFVAFQFFPSLNPRNIIRVASLPPEVQLANSPTWSLVGNSLKSGAKSAALGSGPDTTGIAFGQIKPESLNKTVVWNLTFDRSSTEIANILIETGVLGFVAFEGTAILFLIYALFFLVKGTENTDKSHALGFFVFWLMLYIAHFFYFFNTTFYFLYWLNLGLFMATTHWQDQRTTTLSFVDKPRVALTSMFISLLVLVGLLIGGFFQAAVYAAEVSFASGIKVLNQKNPNFATSDAKFAQAINLNQYRDSYYLYYAQNLIFRASEEAGKKDANVGNIQNWIASAIAAGQKAVSLSPNKPADSSALAQLYTSIRPLGAEGTDDAIIKSWKDAIAKDEKNPVLLIQLANAYSVAAQTIDSSILGTGQDSDHDGLSDARETELGSKPDNADTNNNGISDGDEVKAGFNPAGAGRLSDAQIRPYIKLDTKMLKDAEETLRKAVSLKDDLPDTHIALARILEQEKQLDAARAELDQAVKLVPGNIDVRFEQGRIAYNQKKYDDAEQIFLDVIKAQPNYANAHFSLGLLYQSRGDKDKALAEYEKVREIVGPNVDLEKTINDLKSK